MVVVRGWGPGTWGVAISWVEILSYVRLISSKGLLYNTMPTVNNATLYT